MIKALFAICVGLVMASALNAQSIAIRMSECSFNKEYFIIEIFEFKTTSVSDVSNFAEMCKNTKQDAIPYYKSHGESSIGEKIFEYTCNLFLVKSGDFSQTRSPLSKSEVLGNTQNELSLTGKLTLENGSHVLEYKYTPQMDFSLRGKINFEKGKIIPIGGRVK